MPNPERFGINFFLTPGLTD